MTLDVYLSKELPDKEPPNTVFSVLQNGCLTGQAPIKALNKLCLLKQLKRISTVIKDD